MSRKRNKFILILSVFIFILALAVFFFSLYSRVETMEIGVKFIVEKNNIGFDVNSSVLAFGRFPPGGCSTIRTLDLVNNENFPVMIGFEESENLRGLFGKLDDEALQPSEKREKSLSLCVGEDFPEGSYEGYLRVSTRRRFF